jgi:hyperosmotically inducible periplasmic protein
MSKPSRLLSPSLESAGSITQTGPLRQSLFDTKDAFIQRIAPVGVAAIYFGSFTLSPKDVPLSRQALFKLSFLYTHFLQPGGIRINVDRHTAVLSGTAANRALVTLADILAQQIEGIHRVQDGTQSTGADRDGASAHPEAESACDAIQFLFATDQTLRSGVQVNRVEGNVVLQGEVSSLTQKSWAEHIGEAVTSGIQSQIKVSDAAPFSAPAEPPLIDDESLQALVLFRLRLVRETEHVPLRVKATRGVVSIQGKVRTEALRQRVENIARSTLGLRELRSMLSIA